MTTLNPLGLHDPVKSLNNHTFYSRVWTVTLAVSIVAFTTLGVGAIALTSALWPVHLPVVTIFVLAGALPASASLVTKIWNQADTHKKEAAYDRALKGEWEQIQTEDLPRLTKKLGFSSSADPDVQKSLLARYRLLEKQKESSLSQSAPKEEVALWIDKKLYTVNPSDYQISKVDFEDPKEVKIFNALSEYQLRRDQLTHTAALCHLKGAYLLHLMQEPQDTRSLRDFVTLTTGNPLHHRIAEQAGDPSAHVMAKSDKKTYTKHQVLGTKTHTLAKELFGLRTNWF